VEIYATRQEKARLPFGVAAKSAVAILAFNRILWLSFGMLAVRATPGFYRVALSHTLSTNAHLFVYIIKGSRVGFMA